ncbi:MAG: hypothetical protein LBK82_04315 [Planctomycetaceae bacterium]|jgi:hypothetical protein|nr:hypothetical protein [Planctomycetaceae bacterium]
MTIKHDWLKRNHEELYDQAMLTWTYMLDYMNRDRMGFTSTTAQGQWYDTVFATSFNNFQIKFEDWRDLTKRTAVITEKLKEAEDDFRPKYREFYTGFLKKSPLVTDDDLVSMGLPIRSSGRKPSPVEKTYPDYEIDRSTARRLGIHYFEHDKKSSGKPPGQHGVEVCWAVLDAPPTDVSELTNSSFSTRSPLILDFKENQRGKTVYFCLRWENTRGEKGPWSEIYNTIIP